MSATVLPAGTVIGADGATGPLTAESDTGSILVTIDVTAITGTPSLTVTAQRAALAAVAHQGGTGHVADASWPPAAWDAGIASAAITGPGQYTVVLPALPGDDGSACPLWRIAWTLGGSGGPSLTLGIESEG